MTRLTQHLKKVSKQINELLDGDLMENLEKVIARQKSKKVIALEKYFEPLKESQTV